jgi:hypothetical protein
LYWRSPSSRLLDSTASPIFFPSVPLRNPRTECACQPVAFISSLLVTPPGRLSRSSICAVLLPSRAEPGFFGPLAFVARLGAFFAGLAFLPDLALAGATWRAGFATLGFLVAFGLAPVAVAWAVPVSSSGRDLRGHDMDHSGRCAKQANSEGLSEAMVWRW